MIENGSQRHYEIPLDSFPQNMFDDADTVIPNTPLVNASFELVHTGAGGDGARFNLPSDTAHPAAGV